MNDSAVAVPYTPLTTSEISAILAASGAIDEQNLGYIRMKTQGTSFITDNDFWNSNPKTGTPAFTARLLGPPVQYQAFYFDAVSAEKAGRPDMVKKFCKSHYDNPNENREFGTNHASCRACPFNPFGHEQPKCGWKGDLNFQIIPEGTPLTGDEPIHTITLSLTGMIEWKGTRKTPNAGSVSDKNFMYKLAELSIEQAEEWSVPPGEAILIGLSALNEGLVAAEFRSLIARNEEKGMEWSVISLTPVHVQKPDTGDEPPALESGATIGDELDF